MGGNVLPRGYRAHNRKPAEATPSSCNSNEQQKALKREQCSVQEVFIKRSIGPNKDMIDVFHSDNTWTNAAAIKLLGNGGPWRGNYEEGKEGYNKGSFIRNRLSETSSTPERTPQ
ncbi:hypothetical protein ElyMa_004589000 [Elysia marginata]|uniref:Uncharacterized protein n=1 Tax=Elysia marginata TaxID=1093978 RepID=A0AAV4HVL7_9GAST|nr:hypothetical protein ElyMa_004589000 [Elysia marginata]